jgi:hypothetical protein
MDYYENLYKKQKEFKKKYDELQKKNVHYKVILKQLMSDFKISRRTYFSWKKKLGM